jgi:hypothetical protein
MTNSIKIYTWNNTEKSDNSRWEPHPWSWWTPLTPVKKYSQWDQIQGGGGSDFIDVDFLFFTEAPLLPYKVCFDHVYMFVPMMILLKTILFYSILY